LEPFSKITEPHRWVELAKAELDAGNYSFKVYEQYFSGQNNQGSRKGEK